MSAKVFVGLGGNMRDTVSILDRALDEINNLPNVCDLRCSSFYQTSPVGPIEQKDYVNAVCSFTTTLCLKETHKALRCIEKELGKTPKGKYHPRIIDLDLLFFGNVHCYDEELHVPHPSWNDRLFVLVPLEELVEEVFVPGGSGSEGEIVSLAALLKEFPNRHNETVTFLTHPAQYGFSVNR
jgi:2-amino-4-hydroxy-6-hydroxymethyldihydropteridine diphosphokinase